MHNEARRLRKSESKANGKTYGLDCPVAKALDVVGDRWTLLIIRDLLRGINKYQDLLESLEGISTNLLAERLAKLTEEGIVDKTYYSSRPPRAEYHLSERGEQLASVVDSLFEWGVKWRGEQPELEDLRDAIIRAFKLRPADVQTNRRRKKKDKAPRIMLV